MVEFFGSLQGHTGFLSSKVSLLIKAKQKRSPFFVASSLQVAWVRAGAWLLRNPWCNPCGFVGGGGLGFRRTFRAISGGSFVILETRALLFGVQGGLDIRIPN